MGTYGNGNGVVTLPKCAILSTEVREMLAAVKSRNKQYHMVATETGIHPDILKMLVRYEIIPGGDDTCDPDVAQEIAQRLHAARERFQGRGIVISDAVERYGFSPASIYKWSQQGWIKTVGKAERYNAQLYDEGDVAFAAALAEITGRVHGRSVFPAKPRSGRPKKRK